MQRRNACRREPLRRPLERHVVVVPEHRRPRDPPASGRRNRSVPVQARVGDPRLFAVTRSPRYTTKSANSGRFQRKELAILHFRRGDAARTGLLGVEDGGHDAVGAGVLPWAPVRPGVLAVMQVGEERHLEPSSRREPQRPAAAAAGRGVRAPVLRHRQSKRGAEGGEQCAGRRQATPALHPGVRAPTVQSIGVGRVTDLRRRRWQKRAGADAGGCK